jgi:hypothetical protein
MFKLSRHAVARIGYDKTVAKMQHQTDAQVLHKGWHETF